jgi:hypothetical protein
VPAASSPAIFFRISSFIVSPPTEFDVETTIFAIPALCFVAVNAKNGPGGFDTPPQGQRHHHHHQDCDPNLARAQRALAVELLPRRDRWDLQARIPRSDISTTSTISVTKALFYRRPILHILALKEK